MRRVVVTGLGMVTPLGCGVDTTWARILNGESGARKIDTFEVADLASRIACVIPRGDGSDGTFNPDQWMEPKEQRKVDDFIIFAMAAARQALDDADWHPSTEEDKCATGTLIGSGIGGLSGIADTALLLKERGPRRVSPFFIPGRLINLASGYVLSGDAYHITSPSPDGDGGFRSMSAAIKRAGIAVSDIDYINAHGTSTQIGDEIELGAVERLLGNAASKVSMSSTKSSTGHLLGAAGAVEAIFSILAIRDNIAPPTINLENPSVETAIDLVPQAPRKREIDVALSNSFGFGGTNASVIVRRVSN